MVENRLARIAELTNRHQQLAAAAHANKNVLNDLATASEMHTQSFIHIFQQLKTLYIFSVALHFNGHLYPIPLASLMLLFSHNLAAETQNAQTYQAVLALKNHHGTEHQRHASALSALELQHIVLLALRDEIILRAQGVRNTFLKDLNLNI
jgi:hypothetical protein